MFKTQAKLPPAAAKSSAFFFAKKNQKTLIHQCRRVGKRSVSHHLAPQPHGVPRTPTPLSVTRHIQLPAAPPKTT